MEFIVHALGARVNIRSLFTRRNVNKVDNQFIQPRPGGGEGPSLVFYRGFSWLVTICASSMPCIMIIAPDMAPILAAMWPSRGGRDVTWL